VGTLRKLKTSGYPECYGHSVWGEDDKCMACEQFCECDKKRVIRDQQQRHKNRNEERKKHIKI
jgi:hypothetical protein